jgi:hypothetical protein
LFPVSQYFREKGINLDRSLRALAVHAAKQWTVDAMSSGIQKHFYRAVLEVLFTRHGIVDMQVGRCRPHVYENGFKEYVRTIVERCKLPEILIDEADIINEFNDLKVLRIMCLREMCADVLESLIQLDRWMAVTEKVGNGYVGLHRIFEAETSPRGWAIVAAR